KDQEVRKIALGLLSAERLETSGLRPMLPALLRDSNAEIRQLACRLVASDADATEEEEQFLFSALSDRDPLVRAAALSAISNKSLRKLGSVPFAKITPLCSDPDPQV